MKNKLHNSRALAFWSEHCFAMDHLYEEFYDVKLADRELADSLKGIVSNSLQAGDVKKIINQALKDKAELLSCIRRNIASHIEKKSELVKPRNMYKNNLAENEWSFNVYIHKLNCGEYFSTFYIEIDTGSLGQLGIKAKLWVKKKNSGSLLHQIFVDKKFKFKSDADKKMKSITIFSSIISDYMDKKDNSINLSQIEKDIMVEVKLISDSFWKKIIAIE